LETLDPPLPKWERVTVQDEKVLVSSPSLSKVAEKTTQSGDVLPRHALLLGGTPSDDRCSRRLEEILLDTVEPNDVLVVGSPDGAIEVAMLKLEPEGVERAWGVDAADEQLLHV
jgi:hypothetical protein